MKTKRVTFERVANGIIQRSTRLNDSMYELSISNDGARTKKLADDVVSKIVELRTYIIQRKKGLHPMNLKLAFQMAKPLMYRVVVVKCDNSNCRNYLEPVYIQSFAVVKGAKLYCARCGNLTEKEIKHA